MKQLDYLYLTNHGNLKTIQHRVIDLEYSSINKGSFQYIRATLRLHKLRIIAVANANTLLNSIRYRYIADKQKDINVLDRLIFYG